MVHILGDTPEREEDKDSEVNSEIKKFRYTKVCRHYIANEVQKKQNEKVTLTAAAYHAETNILVVGFNNGSFYLYEMPDVNMIHSLRY